jgi:ABC-2 type transport system ATP-binding protein
MQPEGELYIEARGLSRHFGERIAIDQLDLGIVRGEAYVLLGANGAGKTTFIRLVTGFLLPSGGTLRVAGLSPADHPRQVQRELGFAAENSRLYPELRVEAFLSFMAGVRGLAGSEARRAVERVIERFQLGDVRRRPIGNLSKGFQQRASLAQAFLHEPHLVIVDEPTSGLDPLQQAEVRDVLGELRGSCTVLICTHDLAEARLLASRVGVLAHGRLVAQGGADEILDRGDALALFRGERSQVESK